MELRYEVEGGDFTNAGTASSSVKKILNQLNVQHQVIKKVVVALYEAEVNVVAHAYRGEILAEISADEVRITVSDSGPGIEDIALAMQEGYSTASPKVREMGFGAGMGLPNIKRNCDKLDISSEPGKGTRLQMVNYIN